MIEDEIICIERQQQFNNILQDFDTSILKDFVYTPPDPCINRILENIRLPCVFSVPHGYYL